MAAPRTRPFFHPHAARTRDAALRRLSVLNRLTAVGAVGLALGFTALAARATPPRHAATPTSTAARAADRAPARAHGDDGSEHRPRGGGDDASAAPAQSAAPVQAPAPTPQPPVVVSGGS